MVVVLQYLQRLGAQLWRKIDQRGVRDTLQIEGLRPTWEGLSRRGALARNVARWHRLFFDRPYRLAGNPVENVQKSLFGHLGNGLDLLAVNLDVDQGRRRGQVVVPETVMHRLEMPNPLAGLRIDTHQALREQIVSQSVTAVPIVGRRANRQVDITQVQVSAHHGPHIGVAAVAPRAVLPGVCTQLTALRNGMEYPALLPGADIESAHVPRGHLFVSRPIHNRGADDHDIADNHWSRDDAVVFFIDFAAQSFGQINRAAVSETRIRQTGLGIERPKARVVGGHENASSTSVRPIRDTTVVESEVGWTPSLARLCIEPPNLRAGGCLERHHKAERGADVERIVDHDRRRLEAEKRELAVGFHQLGVRRGPRPCHFQVGNVAFMDLI